MNKIAVVFFLTLLLPLFILQSKAQIVSFPTEGLQYLFENEDVFNAEIIGPDTVCIGLWTSYTTKGIWKEDSLQLADNQHISIIKENDSSLNIRINNATEGLAQIRIKRINFWGEQLILKNIFFYDNPKIKNIQDYEICKSDTVSIALAQGYAAYHWPDSNITHQWSTADSGDFYVSVTNKWGCMAKRNFHITYKTPPQPKLGKDLFLCKGQALQLKPGKFKSYKWHDGSANPTYQAFTSGNYSVKVSDRCGQTGSAKVQVLAEDPPVLNLGEAKCLCFGDSILLDAGKGYNSYQWQDGKSGQTYLAKASGLYKVTAALGESCTQKSAVQVKIVPCMSDLLFPAIFSPNGDGLNDLFRPLKSNFPSYSLQLFDKDGAMVFFGSNKAWDGTFDGGKCEGGLYTWSLQYKDASGKRKFDTGTVRVQ